MSYSLGARSIAELTGVHPNLVSIVRQAILITTQDFQVFDGLRTLKQQRAYVARGASWTLNSKHRRQRDGFGHAVDLVPWIDGGLSWGLRHCYPIASAMSQAALESAVRLRWGGVWDRTMDQYGTDRAGIEQANRAYVGRRRRLKKKARIDGFHFELVV